MADARLQQLEALLRRDGPLTAAAMGRALDVSQPTISRALAAAGDRVVRIGRARASRYALGREIARAGRHWPLYRIDPEGRAEALGELHALHGDGFHFQPVRALPAFTHGDFTDGLFTGLPWFLDDQRPQGFLGRAFARRVAADIGAPEDLARWQADDIALALLRHGDDLPGDLVLGETALQRALQSALDPDAMPPGDRQARYPLLADAALRGEDIGSSAGGEQPKFTALVRAETGVRTVIVKFSERTDTPAGQRWADLLHCEHLAGEVLRAHGIAAAESRLLFAGDRVFLESTRFDRTPALGRRGLVSLAALDAGFYGHGRIDWWRLADPLRRDGWISAGDARALALRGWFGALIANTDMHLGNASLVLADTPPLALAPSYDMLPMALRPASTGEVVAREPDIPLPVPEQREHWQAAAAMAADFWRQVADADGTDAPGISGRFREIAATQLRRLEAAISRVG